jgi:Na+/melibiose symporter-like transporter
MATLTDHQKAAFAERLSRINSGKQFEHADVVGYQTQAAYKRKHGQKAKKPKRSLADLLMVLVAFLSGAGSVLIGRLAYFYLTKVTGLPEAFYNLHGRGMALMALILALVLIVIFQLFTRARLQSLALGCALMHFGEAAVASTAPQFYAGIFSADYVATVAGTADAIAASG